MRKVLPPLVSEGEPQPREPVDAIVQRTRESDQEGDDSRTIHERERFRG